MSKKVPHSQVSQMHWCVWQNDDGCYDQDQVTRAILMDIRNDINRIASILNCHNCKDIPNILKGIRRKLPTKKRRKKT